MSIETETSAYQNRYGVNLNELEEGDFQPAVVPNSGRVSAKVLHADPSEDIFRVEVDHVFEIEQYTLSGDDFRPNVDTIDGALTDEEFDALEEGTIVTIYATGHERYALATVEEIDREDEMVGVRGECDNQTLDRWVDRDLVRLVAEDE